MNLKQYSENVPQKVIYFLLYQESYRFTQSMEYLKGNQKRQTIGFHCINVYLILVHSNVRAWPH